MAKKVTKSPSSKKSSNRPAKKSSTKKSSTKQTSLGKTSAKKTSTKQQPAKRPATKKTPAKKANSKQAGRSQQTSPKRSTKPTKEVPLKLPALVTRADQKEQMQRLESKLRGWLDAHKPIKLDWDCGGDETIIDGTVANKIWPADTPEFETLCDILIYELQLPNAGEEFNKGGGTLELQDGHIVLVYDAVYHGCTWDEEEEDVIELPPEKRQGRLLLFK